MTETTEVSSWETFIRKLGLRFYIKNYEETDMFYLSNDVHLIVSLPFVPRQF